MIRKRFDSVSGHVSRRAGVTGLAAKFGLALVVAVTCAMSPVYAQSVPGPSIGVLDIQRILRESKAAKSIRPQIDKLRRQYQEEVQRQEGQLRKAEQELVRQRAILAPEAFAKRRREFEQRARTAQRDVQLSKRRLDVAFARSMSRVQAAMIQVAQAIANRRKINLVVLKSAVVISKASLDITSETLGRLDKKLANVKVELPEKK